MRHVFVFGRSIVALTLLSGCGGAAGGGTGADESPATSAFVSNVDIDFSQVESLAVVGGSTSSSSLRALASGSEQSLVAYLKDGSRKALKLSDKALPAVERLEVGAQAVVIGFSTDDSAQWIDSCGALIVRRSDAALFCLEYGDISNVIDKGSTLYMNAKKSASGDQAVLKVTLSNSAAPTSEVLVEVASLTAVNDSGDIAMTVGTSQVPKIRLASTGQLISSPEILFVVGDDFLYQERSSYVVKKLVKSGDVFADGASYSWDPNDTDFLLTPVRIGSRLFALGSKGNLNCDRLFEFQGSTIELIHTFSTGTYGLADGLTPVGESKLIVRGGLNSVLRYDLDLDQETVLFSTETDDVSDYRGFSVSSSGIISLFGLFNSDGKWHLGTVNASATTPTWSMVESSTPQQLRRVD